MTRHARRRVLVGAGPREPVFLPRIHIFGRQPGIPVTRKSRCDGQGEQHHRSNHANSLSTRARNESIIDRGRIAMRRFIPILACVLPLAAASVRIYQTNSAGDAVDVIDPATNRVVMQIKDVEVPHGVAFSPDGTRAYISCEAESTLWSVDTKAGKLIAKAPLTGHPNNIAISKDGGRVFVAIVTQPGAVDVIDTASMKNIKSIAVKGGVHNTYVTPDGKFVLAGSIVGKMLTAIDPQTLEIVWEKPFDLGVRPIAFEKNPDGSTRRLFVQLSGFSGFAVVDFKTHEEVQRITLPSEPSGGHTEGGAPSHGIGVAPDGKTLWVDSSLANAVFI